MAAGAHCLLDTHMVGRPRYPACLVCFLLLQGCHDYSATHTLHLLFLLPSGNQRFFTEPFTWGAVNYFVMRTVGGTMIYACGWMINLVDGVDWFMTSMPWSEFVHSCVGRCIKEMIVLGNKSFTVPELGLWQVLSTATMVKRPLCIFGGYTTSPSLKCWQCQLTLARGNHMTHIPRLKRVNYPSLTCDSMDF